MSDTSRGETIRIDNEHVEAREVGGELVILDLKSQNYIGGNPATALLWPLLTKGTTREEMADALVTEYGIGHARAIGDCDSFLATLDELGLLRQ